MRWRAVRKRMIHHEFFTSATLAGLELRTMLTFAGLWIYCDDFGRGEDDSTFIASIVWARRPDISRDDVESDLEALEKAGTICRYVVGGSRFLHIPSWSEHQKVSHPTPSRVPPCHICTPDLYKVWYRENDTATDRYRRAQKSLRRAD